MSEEKISLTMTTTSTAGKTATKSITDINDNATDAELLNFAGAFNNLTTNTLGKVAKVTKREIEEAGELTNPIQSIASGNDAPSGLYTISGTDTNRYATVNESILETFVADTGSPTDGGINITLPNNFTPTVYAGKIKIAPTVNTSDYMISLAIAVAVEANSITLFACTPCVGLTNAAMTEGNVTVQFDSVTVDGVKYAPWTITFTLA